jgi:hypothetical protein
MYLLSKVLSIDRVEITFVGARGKRARSGEAGAKALGMPNGWPFNRESMTMRKIGSLETHCVGSLLVVHLCVCPYYA